MATALFVGAGVGAVAGELLKAILAVKERISTYPEEMKQLEMTLKHIIPLFHDAQRLEAQVMEHLGSDGGSPDRNLMIQRLREGTVLVRESATIRPWSCRKKNSYAKRVLNLNSFLSVYCQREITVEMFRDIKLLLLNVMKNNGNLDDVTPSVPGLGGVSVTDLAGMAGEPVRTSLRAVAVELQQCILHAMEIIRKGENHLEQLDENHLEQLDKTLKDVNPNPLEELGKTLKVVIPCIVEDKQFDGNVMDHRRLGMDQLIAQLREGKVLVEKFTNTRPPWNLHKPHEFSKKASKKVLKLNKELLRLFQEDIQAEIRHYNKQIGHYNKQIMDEMEAQRILNERNRAVNDSSVVPPLPALTVGMAVPLNELKSKLFQDGVNVTGLCAPGGGGKTTLAAALCMDGEVKDKFKENIYFMPVSSSPNLKVIIQVLFKNMVGLSCMPEFQNEEDGLKALGYLLKMEPQPILVVLDDVWSKEIIQKFKFGTTGYKLLITTRIDFECFDYTYHLKMFGKKDAQILFRYLAFPEDGDSEEPLETLANEIVEGCEGFPMLLEVIGNFLRQRPHENWEHVAKMLSRGSSILSDYPELLACLSPSLESMEPQLQECFLDLGSFPKGNRIPAAALIDMWIELYDLDENGAYGNLLELSLRNLVNLNGSGRKDAGDPYGDFNKLFVTQHFLFRDLALYRIQENNRGQNKRILIDLEWEELKNQLFEARVVSIDTGEIDTSSWFEMGFPNAKVLILNFSRKNYCLPPFLKQMEQLKVLIIKNNGLKHAKLRGFPPVASPNLRRIRLEMISIPSLDKIMDPLKNLRKLSLDRCEVGEAVRNCIVDYSAIFPSLSELEIGY